MLKNLTIFNYVIVEKLNLNFKNGFTALTGETGAGKSILIDALSLSLGLRSESGLVRKNSEKSEIISEFDISSNFPAIEWLKENELYEGEELFLRRLIFPDGKSKGFINSIPCPISKLKDIGELLIDIYSQNSFHSLVLPKTQLSILDSYANCGELLKETRSLYDEWHSVNEKKITFEENKKNLQHEYEELKNKIEDYKKLNFTFDDWEFKQNEHKALSNAKEIARLIHHASELVSGEEISMASSCKELDRFLQEAASMDERLGENKEITENIMIQLNELNRNLSHYLSQLEDNENKIVELEQFIQIVFDFSRKYGIMPEFFESSFNEWEIRFQELADLFEENIYELKERELFENFTQSANQLSKLRIKNAEELSKKITGLLNDLSFKSAVFKAEVTQSNPYREGIDNVSFGIKTYEGANIAPISKVASGGELSRISLAIRVASAENSGVPVMIFDEVDVGIGGSVAEIVGNLLFKLGKFQQVFSITHLAQVAAKSNHHYKVVKQEFSDSVTSNIELLNAQDRVNEIARMVGGVDITEATLSYAKEMLAQ